MENNNQQPINYNQPTEPQLVAPEPTISPPPKSKKGLKIFIILLVIVLIGLGILIERFAFNNKKSNNEQSRATQSLQKEDTQNINTEEQASQSFHLVAFGSLDRDPKISTKLAFPQNYQAIANMNGSDSFRSLFGDDKGDMTYEAGEWTIGNPDDGDGNFAGSIGIMGIANDWYNRDGFATYGGFNGDNFASNPDNTTINGYDFSTPKQKKESLDKLISDTANCAKDPKKGFTISDTFNVCYNPYLIRQAYAAYSPQIQFSGYAKIKDVPYVLFGWVSIKTGFDGASDDVLNKAGDDFKAGNIPEPTQKNIDLFIEAFKHSTVTYK